MFPNKDYKGNVLCANKNCVPTTPAKAPAAVQHQAPPNLNDGVDFYSTSHEILKHSVNDYLAGRGVCRA